jgi:hypothetical protein
MKPRTISKYGKKRTHTPDPEQLKDLGLKVPADRPHIGAKEARDSSLESGSPAPGAEQELVANWKPERDSWAGKRGEAVGRLEGGDPDDARGQVAAGVEPGPQSIWLADVAALIALRPR